MELRRLIGLLLMAAALPGCLGAGDDPAPTTGPAPSGPPVSPSDAAGPAEAAPPSGPSAGPPPPERVGPFTFVYDIAPNASASFTVDNASRIDVVAWLNATADGAYVVPNGVTSETGVAFYAPSSEVFAAHSVFWELDAGVADAGATVQGPLESTIETPEPGQWTLTTFGLAYGVQAQLVLTIHHV